MRTGRDRVMLFLKGIAMGMADSVPGVSGGTVALITNIYEELVDTIKSLGWHALVVWKRDGWAAAWRYVNGDFLLTLLSGIVLALVLLARIILFLMDSYLPFLLAFFAGLVLASILFVCRNITRWSLLKWMLLIAGAGFALLLASLPVRDATTGLVYYFFCGAVAICAMILPGISGAFILVLLGAYAPVLEALSNFEWPVVIVFAGGCLTGLMLFSRLLSWLLHHYHEETLALLIGILAGSLFMLWPWRLAIEVTSTAHTAVYYHNVMPDVYSGATGKTFAPVLCLLSMLAGAGLVLLLENFAGSDVGGMKAVGRNPP